MGNGRPGWVMAMGTLESKEITDILISLLAIAIANYIRKEPSGKFF